MEGSGWKVGWYHGLGAVQWAAIVTGAVFAAAGAWSPDAAQQDGLAKEVRERLVWLHTQSVWVVPVAAGIGAVCAGGRKLTGAPWMWAVVKKIVDELHRDLFGHHNAPDYAHRVTLFRYRPWVCRACRWPMSGWLVPVARSGHTRTRTPTKFIAPRDEPERAQGVAGFTYVNRGTVLVPDKGEKLLPDDAHVTKRGQDARIQAYADRTFTTPKWVNNRLKKRAGPMPKSYVGIVITVRDKPEPWGVIVIDSAEAEIDRERVERSFRSVGGTLSKVLEGVW